MKPHQAAPRPEPPELPSWLEMRRRFGPPESRVHPAVLVSGVLTAVACIALLAIVGHRVFSTPDPPLLPTAPLMMAPSSPDAPAAPTSPRFTTSS